MFIINLSLNKKNNNNKYFGFNFNISKKVLEKNKYLIEVEI